MNVFVYEMHHYQIWPRNIYAGEELYCKDFFKDKMLLRMFKEIHINFEIQISFWLLGKLNFDR